MIINKIDNGYIVISYPKPKLGGALGLPRNREVYYATWEDVLKGLLTLSEEV